MDFYVPIFNDSPLFRNHTEAAIKAGWLLYPKKKRPTLAGEQKVNHSAQELGIVLR